ncbi:MAG: hypothetical protein AAFP69_23440, partial [Planctomycetota bacterium]
MTNSRQQAARQRVHCIRVGIHLPIAFRHSHASSRPLFVIENVSTHGLNPAQQAAVDTLSGP